MRLSNSFTGQLFLAVSYLQTFTFSKQGCERRLPGTSLIHKLLSKFDVARQARSTILCLSVRAVPWTDEAEQQLSRIALSACNLSADVRIFRAGLLAAPGTDHLSYV